MILTIIITLPLITSSSNTNNIYTSPNKNNGKNDGHHVRSTLTLCMFKSKVNALHIGKCVSLRQWLLFEEVELIKPISVHLSSITFRCFYSKSYEKVITGG